MPHDYNGILLKVGDQVNLIATITAILPSEGYCNCTIEPVLQMPPYKNTDAKFSISVINTRQLLLASVTASQVGNHGGSD